MFHLGGEVFSAELPLVAFNVPADADFAEIKALLERGRSEGWWHFEVGSATERWWDVLLSKPYLGHVATGRGQPTAEVVDRYEQVLGVPGDPVRTAHEWLCGDQPPAAQRPKAGRRRSTDHLQVQVMQLRHRDDVIGSRHMPPMVRAELDQVTRLATTPCTPTGSPSAHTT
jgi:hypothetical protein